MKTDRELIKPQFSWLFNARLNGWLVTDNTQRLRQTFVPYERAADGLAMQQVIKWSKQA